MSTSSSGLRWSLRSVALLAVAAAGVAALICAAPAGGRAAAPAIGTSAGPARYSGASGASAGRPSVHLRPGALITFGSDVGHAFREARRAFVASRTRH
ncbi:hypothetical protein [Kitasatospora kazusensis]|uniref:hypothetical protein n=1 Tax=Kitasatospora kazusensis TaxID=407974 RepID=UPI0031DBB4BB